MRSHLVRIWIVGLLGAAIAGVVEAEDRFSYGLGIGYRWPAPGAIADTYGGAIEFRGDVEKSWPRASLGLEVGYHRSSASLDEPFFIEDAKGTLSAVPIDLVARLPFSRGALWGPYAGVGFEALWLRESFEYQLDGTDRERAPDSSLHPGALLVVGVDRMTSPHLRFEAFYSYVPIHRLRDSVGSTYEDREAARVEAGGYGVRLAWRLP